MSGTGAIQVSKRRHRLFLLLAGTCLVVLGGAGYENYLYRTAASQAAADMQAYQARSDVRRQACDDLAAAVYAHKSEDGTMAVLRRRCSEPLPRTSATPPADRTRQP